MIYRGVNMIYRGLTGLTWWQSIPWWCRITNEQPSTFFFILPHQKSIKIIPNHRFSWWHSIFLKPHLIPGSSHVQSAPVPRIRRIFPKTNNSSAVVRIFRASSSGSMDATLTTTWTKPAGPTPFDSSEPWTFPPSPSLSLGRNISSSEWSFRHGKWSSFFP